MSPSVCPIIVLSMVFEKGRAAGAVPSTVGIEPTPSGTKPPCTSIKLCCRCGLCTRTQDHPLKIAPNATKGDIFPLPRYQACAVASTVRDGPR